MTQTNGQFINKKVNVQLAITKEQTVHNIQSNLNQIPNWFDTLFYPNGFKAYIISAGPSLEKYVTQLNLVERCKDPNRDFVVFCVKHALPRLVKMGLEPDFCVLLDGREFNAASTHGVNRKALFEVIPDRTIFLVASMSHPGYAEYLMTHGARVLGWHTAVDGLKEFQSVGAVTGPVISGGTSSGTRSIGIANALGIRDITLVSFDSCIINPTEKNLQEVDKKGRPKYLPVDLPVKDPKVTPEQRKAIDALELDFKNKGYVMTSMLTKRFHTTGELLAQAQDFEQMFSNPGFDMRFEVYDDGLVNHMFTNMAAVTKRKHSFIEYFKNAVPRKNLSSLSKVDVTLGNKRETATVKATTDNVIIGDKKDPIVTHEETKTI